jgi:mRNA interferase MazF
VICAPVYSQHDGLSTQVRVGVDEGLKRDSSVHCGVHP